MTVTSKYYYFQDWHTEEYIFSDSIKPITRNQLKLSHQHNYFTSCNINDKLIIQSTSCIYKQPFEYTKIANDIRKYNFSYAIFKYKNSADGFNILSCNDIIISNIDQNLYEFIVLTHGKMNDNSSILTMSNDGNISNYVDPNIRWYRHYYSDGSISKACKHDIIVQSSSASNTVVFTEYIYEFYVQVNSKSPSYIEFLFLNHFGAGFFDIENHSNLLCKFILNSKRLKLSVTSEITFTLPQRILIDRLELESLTLPPILKNNDDPVPKIVYMLSTEFGSDILINNSNGIIINTVYAELDTSNNDGDYVVIRRGGDGYKKLSPSNVNARAYSSLVFQFIDKYGCPIFFDPPYEDHNLNLSATFKITSSN